jgi:hypothetical protein
MPPADASAIRQAGLLALREGRFEDSAGQFFQLVRLQPEKDESWLSLILALGRAWKIEELRALTDGWANVRGSRFACLYDVFTLLMSYSLHEQVFALIDLSPSEGIEALPGLYYEGCIHLLNEDEDEAFDCFSRFKAMAEALRHSLPIGPEDAFNVAYRQASLIEDRPYVDELMAQPKPARPPLTLLGRARMPQTPQVIVAACNGAYFDVFAARYARSVDEQMDGALLHLHVVDPGPHLGAAVDSITASLKRTTLNVSVEPLPAHPSAAYFASARFLVAERLMEFYERDLFVTDIDIEFITDPRPLLPSLSKAGFSCYTYPRFGPSSRYIAYLTHFSHASGGRDMADVVSRFVESKLAVPWPFNWMLDQAAVISALRWLRLNRQDITFIRMEEAFQYPALSLFRQQEQDDAKDDALRAVRPIIE